MRFVLSLTTGYIFIYYSEQMFWAFNNPNVLVLKEIISAWIVYSILAYIFLWTVSAFRISSIWALFLAGALVGWLCEGVIVTTMYDNFPIQLSWTGLAWHSLITVLVGWHWVRKTLQENRIGKTIFLSTLIGVFFGFWAIFWWIETKSQTPVSEFTRNSFLISIPLIFCYWVHDRIPLDSFQPSRFEKIALGMLVCCYFFCVTIQSQPLALYVLPPCLSIIFGFLWINRKSDLRPDLIKARYNQTPAGQYFALFLIPLVASMIYSISFYFDIRIPTNQVVYLIATPLGFLMFPLSAATIVRQSRKSRSSTGSLSKPE
jgi:hypothetical protein